MKGCTDESVLQEYFDAELSDAEAERVSRHLAVCSACCELAREVESENALLSEAFEPEFGLGVPTSRLKARIDTAINAERASLINAQPIGNSWVNRLASLLGLTSLRQPGFAMALGVLVICAVAILVFLRTRATRPSDSTTVAKAGRIEGSFEIKPDELANS